MTIQLDSSRDKRIRHCLHAFRTQEDKHQAQIRLQMMCTQTVAAMQHNVILGARAYENQIENSVQIEVQISVILLN